jgi:hypothetical protein
MTIDALAGAALKLGYFNDAGWVGYVRDGTSLVRRFEPLPGTPHPDLGCNVEVHVGSRYLELELLGPLAALEPGATVTLLERWEIGRVDRATDMWALADQIDPNRRSADPSSDWLPS